MNNKYIGTKIDLKEGLNTIYRLNSSNSIDNEKILREQGIIHNIYFLENDDKDIYKFFDKIGIYSKKYELINDLEFFKEYIITPINIYVKDKEIVLIRQGFYKNKDEIDKDKVYFNNLSTKD